MEVLWEIIFEFLIQRIIVRFFGYYTLYCFYRLTSNEKGLDWLVRAKNGNDVFGDGCLVSVVGIFSCTVIFFGLGCILNYFWE